MKKKKTARKLIRKMKNYLHCTLKKIFVITWYFPKSCRIDWRLFPEALSPGAGGRAQELSSGSPGLETPAAAPWPPGFQWPLKRSFNHAQIQFGTKKGANWKKM